LPQPGLADEPERLAVAQVEADAVDRPDGADLPLEDRALQQRVVAHEVASLEDDLALRRGDPRDPGLGQPRQREDVGRPPAAAVDLLGEVARGPVVRAADRDQRRLDPAAGVERERTARRERAARGEVDERRGRAVDRYERAVARLVRARDRPEQTIVYGIRGL
jgi:hypothetical protein